MARKTDPCGKCGIGKANLCARVYPTHKLQAALMYYPLCARRALRRVAKLEGLIVKADLGSREALACPSIPAEAARIAKRRAK